MRVRLMLDQTSSRNFIGYIMSTEDGYVWEIEKMVMTETKMAMRTYFEKCGFHSQIIEDAFNEI